MADVHFGRSSEAVIDSKLAKFSSSLAAKQRERSMMARNEVAESVGLLRTST